MPINWPGLVEIIRSNERFLLTSHIRPDCDALGSELGMAGILEQLGKRVRIVNAQPTPPNYRFIDPDQTIKALGIDVQMSDLQDVQVLIVLDTSAWAQLGAMGDVLRATAARKIIIDHHVGEDDLGAEPFKDTKAEATGWLVVQVAQHLNVKLTPQIAMPLFAAIATDTGWYRFGSTTGDTYRAAGELVDAGAKPSAIYNALYEQDTLSRVKLIGRILSGAETDMNGRLIFTQVLQDDFKAVGALPSDTEDVINFTLNVRDTQVAVIFVEQANGCVKVSFRSRAGVDCNQLAQQFGGGGHKAAAGAIICEPLPAVRAKVLDAVRAAMR